jgi:ABC-type antimicrobial peptide transport system permease subunit
MYFPHWQAFGNYMTPNQLVVQTEGDPMTLANAVRHAIQSVDADQPVDDIFPLDDLIDTDVAPRRIQALLIGGLALLAMVIASLGIYGVMAYLVSQRTQEMGIRMALGAQRSDVMALVLWRGTKIAITGVAAGICVAAGLIRLMRGLLFEISPADPGIFAAVSVLLLLVALAACALPGRRAASIDPMRALRTE